ncbi:MAG: thioredoxin family protein [Bacteroidales bacterium]
MKNTVKALTTFMIIMVMSAGLMAQEKVKLYDPALDGMKQIKEATALAKQQGKHVLVQFGGNWCGWCIKFDAFCKADSAISSVINKNYVPVKMNYSPENYNNDANAFMGNPSRFGFPVFIIIDGNGKVLHIQDSGLLEEGQGYSAKKVIGFFRNWTPAAIVPKVMKPPVKK